MKDLTWKSEYQVCVIAWKSLSGMIYMFMINTCIKFHNKNCPEQLLIVVLFMKTQQACFWYYVIINAIKWSMVSKYLTNVWYISELGRGAICLSVWCPAFWWDKPSDAERPSATGQI